MNNTGGIVTGYWGSPGQVCRGVIHAFKEGKTLCGQTAGVHAMVQFCAHGVHRSMIDCKRCGKKLDGVECNGRPE